MTMKLCELNSFHSNTERKKQEGTNKMAYFEVKKWCECILHVEYRKYRKNGSVSIVVSAICRPCISSYANFGQPRTGMEQGSFFVGYFTAELRKPVCIDVASKSE